MNSNYRQSAIFHGQNQDSPSFDYQYEQIYRHRQETIFKAKIENQLKKHKMIQDLRNVQNMTNILTKSNSILAKETDTNLKYFANTPDVLAGLNRSQEIIQKIER